MLTSALEFGGSQTTLALFTSLAPAGAFAFIVVALYGAVCPLEPEERLRLERYAVVPIAVAIVGLLASTNHLGKPSNSLFVLLGSGRSPLSNEVLASVTFVGLAWIRWMISYSSRRLRVVRGLLLACACAGAVCQVWFTSNAYSISTIAVWDLPFTQVNQIAVATMGGSLLALATLRAAHVGERSRLSGLLLAAAAMSTTVLAVSASFQWSTLSAMQGGLASVAERTPFYLPLVLGAVAAMYMGVAVCASGTSREGGAASLRVAVGCAMAFAGIFATRFAFYCLYLTVGL